jgi:riboflavin kinase / FMN adenylyltransferase
MRVIDDLTDLAPHARSVAIGTFDGVHIGHQLVIDAALEAARARDLTAAVVTFDHHPLAVVDPAHQPRLLTPPAVKQELIAALGIDELIVLHFDAALAGLEASAFCRDVLKAQLQTEVAAVGENFTYGARGAGTAASLADCGRQLGFETIVVPLLTSGGRPISSSRIRRLLHEGRLPDVRAILGRPPRTVGLVVHGDKRGRTLGFPTANIEAHTGMIFPGRGVYAARVRLHGRWYRAAVNVGHNPTFLHRGDEEAFVRIEAYLLDFSGDAYGAIVTVDFLARLRDEEKFARPAELVERMHNDIERTAALDDESFAEAGL